RLALLYHVVTRVATQAEDRCCVERKSIEAGVMLTRWFAGEFRRVYACLSETEGERKARELVRLIEVQSGRMTVRGLMRTNCRRWPTAEAAEADLGGLVEKGLARRVEAVGAGRGGLPVKAIELCMTHDSDDSEPGRGE